MIDITKDEWWGTSNESVINIKEEARPVKQFILKHKILSICLIFYGVCIFANIVLIYSFLRMVKLL